MNVFAPVASMIKADDIDDAINLAHNSEYGLSAVVLTNNTQHAMLMAEK